jgi:hypothetical protein
MTTITVVMFWLNISAFLILVVLNAAPLLWFPGQLFADLIDHEQGVGFFTVIAASCVLGSQLFLMTELRVLAVA